METAVREPSAPSVKGSVPSGAPTAAAADLLREDERRPKQEHAPTGIPRPAALTKRSVVSATLLRTQSDARLLRLATIGQEAAFEALVRRYQEPLRRYCKRSFPVVVADDIVQRAFIALWSACLECREVRDARAWLYRVVRNTALNEIRNGRGRSEELGDVVAANDSPEASFERGRAAYESLAALVSLPDSQREAMTRSAMHGESRAQIAAAMGLSDGAVGQLLLRARRSMQTAMSAVVPWPLLRWALGSGRYNVGTAARIAELSSSGGGGWMADVAYKGGAAVAVVLAAAGSTQLVGAAAPHRTERPRGPAVVLAAASPSAAKLALIPSTVRTLVLASTPFAVTAVRESAARTHGSADTSAPASGAGATSPEPATAQQRPPAEAPEVSPSAGLPEWQGAPSIGAPPSEGAPGSRASEGPTAVAASAQPTEAAQPAEAQAGEPHDPNETDATGASLEPSVEAPSATLPESSAPSESAPAA